MAFSIQVAGRPDRVLCLGLADLVGEDAIRSAGDSLTFSVVDQAALVTVVARLNDLGLAIERIERDRDAAIAGG